MSILHVRFLLFGSYYIFCCCFFSIVSLILLSCFCCCWFFLFLFLFLFCFLISGFDFKVKFCLSRWNNLRGQFQKELRHFNKLCPKSGLLRRSTWPYLQRLRFLESTLQFNRPKKLPTNRRRRKDPEFGIIDYYQSNDYADDNAVTVNTLINCDSCETVENRDGNTFHGIIDADSLDHSTDANCFNYTDIECRNADDEHQNDATNENIQANGNENDSNQLELQASMAEQHEDIVEHIWPDEDNSHIVESFEDDTGYSLIEEDISGSDCSVQTDHRTDSSKNSVANLNKIQTLLMGFNDENRHRIERRILAFLCKCQLRLLINYDINDLCI